jgi:hypothetical protein
MKMSDHVEDEMMLIKNPPSFLTKTSSYIADRRTVKADCALRVYSLVSLQAVSLLLLVYSP